MLRFRKHWSRRVTRHYLSLHKPAVTESAIFLGDSGNRLVALDRTTGEQLWSRRHSESGSWHPWIVHKNRLVVEQMPYVHGLDIATGDVAWTRFSGLRLPTTWGARLLLGANDGTHCLVVDAEDGRVIEEMPLSPSAAGSWVAVSEVAHEKDFDHRRMPDGALRHIFSGVGPRGEPIDPLYCRDGDAELWRRPVLSEIQACPPGMVHGEVPTFAGNDHQHLYYVASTGVFAFRVADGTRAWHHAPLPGDVLPRPTFQAGCVWVVTTYGLYGLRAESGLPVAWWSRLRDAKPAVVADSFQGLAVATCYGGRVTLLDPSSGMIAGTYDGPDGTAWAAPPDLLVTADPGRLHVARERPARATPV